MKKISLLVSSFFVLLSCSQESDSPFPKSRLEALRELAGKYGVIVEYYGDDDIPEKDFQKSAEIIENFYGEEVKED